jgi:hypothetical protein
MPRSRPRKPGAGTSSGGSDRRARSAIGAFASHWPPEEEGWRPRQGVGGVDRCLSFQWRGGACSRPDSCRARLGGMQHDHSPIHRLLGVRRVRHAPAAADPASNPWRRTIAAPQMPAVRTEIPVARKRRLATNRQRLRHIHESWPVGWLHRSALFRATTVCGPCGSMMIIQTQGVIDEHHPGAVPRGADLQQRQRHRLRQPATDGTSCQEHRRGSRVRAGRNLETALEVGR